MNIAGLHHPEGYAPQPVLHRRVIGVGRLVLARVSRETGLSIPVILSRRRNGAYAARARIAVILKDDYGWSNPRIAKLLGRDPTTIWIMLNGGKAKRS